MTSGPIRPRIRVGAEDPDDPGEALRRDLKDAAAWWPSGVAVAAVRDGSAFEAITITTFASISLDPPLVLMSIHRHAAVVTLLDAAARWSINFLGGDQARMASMIADRIPNARTHFTTDDVPVLRAAPWSLVCALHERVPAGDHWLYLGRVERVLAGPTASPLLYHERSYRRLD